MGTSRSLTFLKILLVNSLSPWFSSLIKAFDDPLSEVSKTHFREFF